MKSIKINELEIQYDDSQSEDVQSLKTILKNNYELFLSMLNLFNQGKVINLISGDDKAIKISDIDKWFYEYAKKVFDTEENNKAFDDPKSRLLSCLYIEILAKEFTKNGKTTFFKGLEISYEEISSLIAYGYYRKNNGSFDEFVEYLKYRKDQNKIMEWLKSSIRFDAYNFILAFTVEYLNNCDVGFIENINGIIDSMIALISESMFEQVGQKGVKIPTTTLEEIDKLFYEFLDYINAPLYWRQVYDELKENKRISYVESNENGSSMCYYDEDRNLNLLIINNGTIETFHRLVHEFAHCISMKNKNVSFGSLGELPSIFFEKIAFKFLQSKKCYDDEVIKELTSFRRDSNLSLFVSLSPLFSEIKKFMECGQITKMDKINGYINYYEKINKLKNAITEMFENSENDCPDLSGLTKPDIDIEEMVNRDCDDMINSFVENGIFVINGYQYLLASYLAGKLVERSTDDPTILSRMFKVTLDLESKNLQDILTIFDMQNLFVKPKEDNGFVKTVTVLDTNDKKN